METKTINIININPSIEEIKVTASICPVKAKNTVYEIITELRTNIEQYEKFLKKLEKEDMIEEKYSIMNPPPKIPGW